MIINANITFLFSSGKIADGPEKNRATAKDRADPSSITLREGAFSRGKNCIKTFEPIEVNNAMQRK